MKINPHAVLKDIRGNALKDGDKDMTLGDVIAGCLAMTPSKEDGATKQADVVRSWKLAMRFTDVKKGQHVEVTPEEVVKIKVCVAESQFVPMITGQVLSMMGGVE